MTMDRFVFFTMLILASTLRAGDATPIPVPAVLEPLKAKIGNHYAFKGTTLSFRAEEPLTEDQWQAITDLKLKLISTGGKGIDDAAIERMAKLDPEGLVLDGLTQLKEFSSWHTQNGDPTNPYLLNLNHLESLTIGNSLKRWDGKPRQLCLTDATIPTLAKMTSLQSLTLMQSRLSYSALLQLKSLTNLKKLRFDSVDVSAEEFEKLRMGLPGVTITGKPLSDDERKKLDEFLK